MTSHPPKSTVFTTDTLALQVGATRVTFDGQGQLTLSGDQISITADEIIIREQVTAHAADKPSADRSAPAQDDHRSR